VGERPPRCRILAFPPGRGEIVLLRNHRISPMESRNVSSWEVELCTPIHSQTCGEVSGDLDGNCEFGAAVYVLDIRSDVVRWTTEEPLNFFS
jgi:hypothetical protein